MRASTKRSIANSMYFFLPRSRRSSPRTHRGFRSGPRGRCGPSARARGRNDRHPSTRCSDAVRPRRSTTGSSSVSSASLSLVPCRNSIGILISARCLARSSDGFPAGCSGKPKNASPSTPIKRRNRLRLRGHAAAERSAARDQAQRGAASPGFGHRGAHGGVRNRRRVGPLAALFHVGKLIAQRRHAAFGEALGGGLHGGMGHSGPCPMGKDKARARIGGADQQRGDRARIADRDLELLRTDDFHGLPPNSPAGRNGITPTDFASRQLRVNLRGMPALRSRSTAASRRIRHRTLTKGTPSSLKVARAGRTLAIAAVEKARCSGSGPFVSKRVTSGRRRSRSVMAGPP